MDGQSVHSNCAQRSCRTEVLAGSATDTHLLIHNRKLVYHADGACRTVAGTVAACHSVSVDNAELRVEFRCSDMPGELLELLKREDGSRRADLRAGVAFRAAPAVIVVHLRLHEMVEILRRTENSLRTI